MTNIRIVEYVPSYAKSLADMWRKSSEGWNGFYLDTTEEEMLTKHEGTTNINTYLALMGEEVVGYCAFSEYLEDEGALYIKTLNARFDLHGKGIGKALVLKSIERTIELGWPRLDLYTWASNSKSIPLYKKCGFFLEKRDDTTHLMNFIPTVMNTEAIKDYFSKMDWYEDMKRDIHMEPDDVEENGFQYYEYHWKKEEQQLKVQFERRGRGIRAIETEDYSIKLSCKEPKLVLGRSYKAIYEIVNKSGKPLQVELKGTDDKNIKFPFKGIYHVKENQAIEGDFYIGSIEDEFNNFQTHPAIASEVFINGKKALFSLGIVPQYPAKITLNNKEDNYCSGSEANLFINIENNFDCQASFTFQLPESPNIKLHASSFNIRLEEKEKVSIKVPATVIKPGIYEAEAAISAELEDKSKVHFQKKLSVVFKGSDGRFGGETDTAYIISNGNYSVELDKFENILDIKEINKNAVSNSFNFPKLGKPYSQEFSNKKPSKVEYFYEDQSIGMKVSYVSKDFQGIVIKGITRLYGNGIVEHYHEISNESDKETLDEIYFNGGVYHVIGNTIMPYNHKLIRNINTGNNYIGEFDINKIDENWIYSNYGETNAGLCWKDGVVPKLDDGSLYVEYNLGKIPSKGTRVTKPMYLAINTFKSYEDFRAYAQNKYKNNKELEKEEETAGEINKVTTLRNTVPVDDFEFTINSGNPFVKDNFTVKIQEHKESIFDGIVTLKSQKGIFESLSKEFKNEDSISEVDLSLSINKDFTSDTVTFEGDFYSSAFEKKAIIFSRNESKCTEKIIEEEGHKVYSFNNGIMEIKACPTFSHTLHSIIYDNKQWLESSFPKLEPRTWYNPWFGGISTVPEMYLFSGRSLQEEDISCEFIAMKDNFKNPWQGIKVKLHFNKEEKYKGISVNQYYLTLPGTSVLCHTSEIVHENREFIDLTEFRIMNFFKIGEEIKDNWVKIKNKAGETVKEKCGRTAKDIFPTSSLLYGNDRVEQKIQMYMDFKKILPWVFINLQDNGALCSTKVSGYHDERIFTSPIFYIFTEDYIEDKLLEQLKNIRF